MNEYDVWIKDLVFDDGVHHSSVPSRIKAKTARKARYIGFLNFHDFDDNVEFISIRARLVREVGCK